MIDASEGSSFSTAYAMGIVTEHSKKDINIAICDEGGKFYGVGEHAAKVLEGKREEKPIGLG